eukprot:644124-Amphidinium_carterae.1
MPIRTSCLQAVSNIHWRPLTLSNFTYRVEDMASQEVRVIQFHDNQRPSQIVDFGGVVYEQFMQWVERC